MNTYKETKLSNKSRLITVPEAGSKTVTALFAFKTGSRNETRKNNGISHFLEHMFFKGSTKYPNTLALSGALDALGCEFNAFTGKEYTCYYVKAAYDKMDRALNILGDMMLNPLLEAKEIKQEKGVIIEELNMYRDNPMMHIDDVVENCLYGDNSAGWDIIGSKENISNFKRNDFINYLKKQYGAETLRLVLAGKLDKKLIDKGEKILKQFNPGHYSRQPELKEAQKQPHIKGVHKKIDQVVLALAVRSFPVGHKDEVAVKLLAIILGGAMSSRLFISLRERKGLAYSVRSNTEVYSNSGYLNTQAGVPAGKAVEAVKIILKEYRRLKTELVSKEELDRVKDMLEGKTIMHMESSDDLANWYARESMLRDKMRTPTEMLKQIRALNADDLRRVARDIFKPENLNLAYIGPVPAKNFSSIMKL